jgi:hypothetical protein
MSKNNRIQIYLNNENQALFNAYRFELERKTMAKASDSQAANYMINSLREESKLHKEIFLKLSE